MTKFDYDRGSGLGASDAPAVLGISPWVTPLQLFEEKTGRGVEQDENLAMAVGTALEPVVLREFTKRTGLEVSNFQERVIDPRLPWRWATLDACASDGALVEAKTAAGGKDVARKEPTKYRTITSCKCSTRWPAPAWPWWPGFPS